MSTVKEQVTHYDCVGNSLKIGDCIAVAHHNELLVAVIKKMNPKMVKVAILKKGYKREYNKYPEQCALLEGPQVTMFMLKASA